MGGEPQNPYYPQQPQQHYPEPPGQQPQAMPPAGKSRSKFPWWARLATALVLAFAIVLVIDHAGNSVAGGGSSCKQQAGTWWWQDGGRAAYNRVESGLQAVISADSALTALPGNASGATVRQVGSRLESAGGQLRDAATGELGHLAPGCASQLDHDLAAWDADEGLAGTDFGALGQDVKSGDSTDAQQSANQASDDQGRADRDAAAVVADLKVLVAN